MVRGRRQRLAGVPRAIGVLSHAGGLEKQVVLSRVDSKCWGKPMQSEDKLEGGGGAYMSAGRLGMARVNEEDNCTEKKNQLEELNLDKVKIETSWRIQDLSWSRNEVPETVASQQFSLYNGISLAG